MSFFNKELDDTIDLQQQQKHTFSDQVFLDTIFPSEVAPHPDFDLMETSGSEALLSNAPVHPGSGSVESGSAIYQAFSHDSSTYLASVQAKTETLLVDNGMSAACGNCQHANMECVFIGNTGSILGRVCTNCFALNKKCVLASRQAADLRDSTSEWTFSPQLRFSFQQHAPPLKLCSVNASPRPMLKGNGSDGSANSSGKSSARFSREIVRILRQWSSDHYLHPYPTEGEKETLQKRTGLNKVQITNWLANARRRGLVKPSRSRSPGEITTSRPVIIPQHHMAVTDSMDPMERWQSTPPGLEPASIASIARAMGIAGINSQQNPLHLNHARSRKGSIARTSSESSIGQSSGSNHSSHSGGSFGSFGTRNRRRRSPIEKLGRKSKVLTTSTRPYQCTFCSESFKTKHDWQRHEKSLHLSLEKWTCAPNGGFASAVMGRDSCCAYCGISRPNATHLAKHNYSNCVEKTLEERTFYRKDHLRQHLRLVHNNCNFQPTIMDCWRTDSPEICSRCGFCDVYLGTWVARADHLAEHFKSGKTMDDWNGDWGFSPPILKMVEGATPPNLERNKKDDIQELPSCKDRHDATVSRYEILKGCLLEYCAKKAQLGQIVTNENLRAEGYRIFIGNEQLLDLRPRGLTSWFRDLLACSDDEVWLQGLRKKAGLETSDCDHEPMDIDNEQSLIQYCELERSLYEFVKQRSHLGLTVTDFEIRQAACKAVIDFDQTYSRIDNPIAATWLCKIIMNSNTWLAAFRRRVKLPPTLDRTEQGQGTTGASTNISTSLSNRKFENELAAWAITQLQSGKFPEDEEFQEYARMVVFGGNESWDQTPADDCKWLSWFKSTYGLFQRPGLIPHGLPTFPSFEDINSRSAKPIIPAHLEAGLLQYFTYCLNQGLFITEENLSIQARTICGYTLTPRDDLILITYFKQRYGLNIVPCLIASSNSVPGEAAGLSIATFPDVEDAWAF